MAGEDERHTMLIRGCDVLDVPATGECQVLRARDISVRDGVIEAIEPSRPELVPGATEVIEARGLLAIPGLINAHTHSPMVLMRGAAEDMPLAAWFNERIWPMERNLTAADVRLGALLACAEMIRAGVTAFADHYFFADEIAAAVVSSGLRANIAHTHFSSRGREGLEAGLRFAADWHGRGNGRVAAAMGPHAPYTVTDADLSLLADHARRLGIRVHVHASEDAEQTNASLRRRGITPIGVLETTGVLDAGALIAHGCGIVDADLALLAPHAATTAVACCPKVYLKYAMRPLTPVRKLLEAGVTVAAATDGAASHNTLDVLEAVRLIAMTQKHAEQDATWMTVSDVLRLATRGGARALGWGDELGALEPGRRADVVLVDLTGLHCVPVHDPRAALAYSARASDVRTVIVGGRVLLRDGRLLTVDVDALLPTLDACVSRLTDIAHGETVQRYEP